MKTIIIRNNKFKQDKEKIENILISYAFKQITETIYIGNLNTEETNDIEEEIRQIIKDNDTLIILPVCEGCYKNIIQIGTEIELEEEKYVIL